MNSEQSKTDGNQPIEQRRFFKVTYTVNMKGYPVMSEEYFSPGLGVDRVCIIKKCGSKNGGRIHDKPK